MRLSTRIQKSTRSQSHSLHPKKIYCYTTIAYCDDLGCIRCVWILYTAHGVRREMRLSTQTVFRLILYKQKIFRHRDRILCEKSVYRWYVSILYTDQGNMEGDCLHKFVKGQTDINLISLEIYCDPRNAYCVRNRCAGGADSVHSS